MIPVDSQQSRGKMCKLLQTKDLAPFLDPRVTLLSSYHPLHAMIDMIVFFISLGGQNEPIP
jgi:hypothetical protein